MPTVKLTGALIDALPAPTKTAQEYYWDQETKGLGVVVGRSGVKTFITYAWLAGEGRKSKVKIGRVGELREDRQPWTLILARAEAKALVADAARGVDRNAPEEPEVAAANPLTLREALELHLTEMADNKKRPISITTMRYDVERLLTKELDRPLAELTVESVQRFKKRGVDTKTQTNRVLAHISAIWNTALRLRRSTFALVNPVGRVGVQKYRLIDDDEPDRRRLEPEEMPEWLRRVETLRPVRRDLQLIALFTGLRDSNMTSMRWEMIDEKRGALIVPRSKTTPFRIPLSSSVVEMLARRRNENALEFGDLGGDAGWIFPTKVFRKFVSVGKSVETKERRRDYEESPDGKRTAVPPWGSHLVKGYKFTGERGLYLPGLHTLRRTFTSVAHEAGVPDIDQRILTNHKIGGRDVHERYVHASFDHLHVQTSKIEAALWSLLKPKS